MFNFRKKTSEKSEREKDEKERRKKEKKERKERLKAMDTSTLSPEEMARLEEMRKAMKDIERAKRESQNPTDNADNDTGSSGSSRTWSVSSATGSLSRTGLGAPPPLPPSKGILKGKDYNVARTVSADPDDASVLLKNTQANENLFYENVKGGKSPKSPLSPERASLISPGESADRELGIEHVAATTKVRAYKDHVSPVSPTKLSSVPSGDGSIPPRPSSMTKPMSSAELRSLVGGEAVGVNQRPLSSEFDIRLPGERDAGDEELVKVVTVEKRGEGSGRKGREGDSFGIEFGIGLLKKVGRGKRTASVVREEEVVIVQSVNGAGLLPGDRVMEVNGVECTKMKLEQVADLVRKFEHAGETKITLKVSAIFVYLFFVTIIYFSKLSGSCSRHAAGLPRMSLNDSGTRNQSDIDMPGILLRHSQDLTDQRTRLIDRSLAVNWHQGGNSQYGQHSSTSSPTPT